MHAFVMQYQLLPPLHVRLPADHLPALDGTPDLSRWHYVPVGLGLLGGQLAVVGGMLFGQAAMVHVGVMMTLVGWTYGLSQLLRVLLAERRAGKGPTWHALVVLRRAGVRPGRPAADGGPPARRRRRGR